MAQRHLLHTGKRRLSSLTPLEVQGYGVKHISRRQYHTVVPKDWTAKTLGPGSAACMVSWTGGKTNSSVGDRRFQTGSFIIHRPPDFGPFPVPLWMPILRLKWETKIALEWFKDLTKPLVPGAWRDKREHSCHYCCIVSCKKGRGAWNRMLACPREKKSQLKQACMHISL